MDKIKELILEKEKEGKVVILTVDGYVEADLGEIIKHNLNEYLSDLRALRDEGVATPLPCPAFDKILSYRRDCCAGCKWHPHVCKYCEKSLDEGNI